MFMSELNALDHNGNLRGCRNRRMAEYKSACAAIFTDDDIGSDIDPHPYEIQWSLYRGHSPQRAKSRSSADVNFTD